MSYEINEIQMLPPQPLPAFIGTSIVELTNGTKMIQLTISTGGGTNFAFMPPEVAIQIGEDMATKAREIDGPGLVIPPPATVHKIGRNGT